jgi:formylmethanofuran dehydrogenase subunit A
MKPAGWTASTITRPSCSAWVLRTENGFSVLGSYPDPTGGPDWGWRTVVELLDKDHLVITAYNIIPRRR